MTNFGQPTQLEDMKRGLPSLMLVALLSSACQGIISGSGGGSGDNATGTPGTVGAGRPVDTGTTAGGSGSNPSVQSGDPNAVGVRPLTRLNRREYNNTVRDLLGDTTQPADSFADDRDRTFQFRRAGLVATQDAEILRGSAEKLAAAAIGKVDQLAPCASGADEAGCATHFIEEFGRRAFRRPLDAAEKSGLQALYQTARGTLGLTYKDAVGVLLEEMLQSPAFLYHWESPFGMRQIESGAVKLGPYDLASRLSYFIWGTMPDQALFDAAAGGRLATDADLVTQAQRMLQDPRAEDAVVAFFEELFELDGLADLPKDSKTYPDYTPAVTSALEDASAAFVKSVFSSSGKLDALLTADFSLSDQTALAKVYSSSGTGARRGGLLVQPGFLSVTGAADESHPVKRGKAVYTKLLCGDLPAPPANVPPAQPASAGGTTRQRFTEHDQNPCAKACHTLMDPFGFAFEHYDGIGRYRTEDNGSPVDSTSQATIDGRTQPFADALELSKILATSDTVRSCVAKQWFRFAFTRSETDGDAPSLAGISAAFARNDYNLRDLLPAIAASRSFRYRAPAQGEVMP